jgi:N,N'-diacetyllegionaminate synthase
MTPAAGEGDHVVPERPHLIAEIGSVHDGSFGNAKRLIDLATACGADAVKFQTHLAEAESLPDAPSPSFFSAEPRLDYFRRTGFGKDEWSELRDHAEHHGVLFISSAFSLEAVDLLEDLGVRAHKVPSGEVTNLPLLERLAATGKPVYLSSGMSDWAELDATVEVLTAGGGRVVVMQCSSRYPCPPEHVGLNVLGEMGQRYGLPVGFSDHTLGSAAAIAAVALGAEVVEKHVTFSKLMYGSDAAHSMEPDEFGRLAAALAEVRAMLAHPVDKDDIGDYRDMKLVFQKSVVTAVPVAAGTVLDLAHLAYKKPGDGIPAAAYRSVVGSTVRRDLPADHKLHHDDLG